MKIEEKLDTGPVCNSYTLDILDNENVISLSERLSILAAEKILDNIDAITDDKALFKSQDESKATYANKISKSEGKINWHDKAENIIGKINGIYPNAYFLYNGERYKILKAKISSGVGSPGDVLSDRFEIGCKEGTIKVLEIQREGKRPQKIDEFILGTKIKKGSSLKDV